MPSNFDATARLGARRERRGARAHFVIEADEYDTAFFDKRAKFVHYRPRTLILNNLEYDHADIYPDVASIRRQFTQLLRTVPATRTHRAERRRRRARGGDRRGLLDAAPDLRPGARTQAWSATLAPGNACGEFTVLRDRRAVAQVRWPLLGEHNVMNALAAIAAADHVGVAARARGARAHAIPRREAPHGDSR